MKTSKLICQLKKHFPAKFGYEKDFFGLQLGKWKKETKCIVICLDFDEFVFNRIKKKKIDLILTHHPFIYGKKKDVLQEDSFKRCLVKKIEKLKIPIYSIHTNFDGAIGGMNDNLAMMLHLKNIKLLKGDKIARGGELPCPMTINNFIKYVKKCLKLPYVYLINYGKKIIKKVAICGGAGSNLFRLAYKNNYDIFCSGDAPHHVRHDVHCYHYNYLEIAHEVENIFMFVMEKFLKKADSKLKIIKVVNQKIPKIL